MYSLDFRRQVLKVSQKEGLSVRELAQRFHLSKTSIMNWKKRLSPTLKRNKRPVKIDHNQLIQDVKQYPDAYQHERAERLGVSRNCVHFALKRLNITYKKKPAASQSQSRKKSYVLPKD